MKGGGKGTEGISEKMAENFLHWMKNIHLKSRKLSEL